MPPNRHGPTDLMDTDISYPLNRLFDPYNMDEIPEKDRMKYFKHRDLPHVKHYKAAVRIFGGPLSRKRVIIAPPMETPLKHRLGLYHDRKTPPPPPVLNSELKLQLPPEKEELEELVIARQAREREDKYKSWVKERQKFRDNLENMGLNMDWLENKPNKTSIEKRLLSKMKNDKLSEEEAKRNAALREEEKLLTRESSSDSSSSVPSVKIPAPLGLRILEEHLRKKKLRLIDIFKQVDKDKNWKVSKEEFTNALKVRDIPMSDALLEDMMICLDMNLDDELDYKELAAGMAQMKKERMESKRRQLSRESTAVSSKSAGSRKSTPGAGTQRTPDMITEAFPQDSQRSPVKTPVPVEDPGQRVPSKSEKSSRSPDHSNQPSLARQGTMKTDTYGTQTLSRSSSPGQYLEPPDMDLRPEQMVLPSEEAMLDLRKRDREALKGTTSKTPKEAPGIIKVGSRAIDSHCMKSTLDGDVGEMIDDFRQKRLKEFHEIVKLCEERGVVLSRNLLEKVLLYPPDLPHGDLKKLRPPDMAPLVSAHFADPPKRPRTPIEVKHKDRVRRSTSGRLLIDSRHKYPSGLSVAPAGTKVTLSTGRAVIRRNVDCWMTFEEYEKLTRHLGIRYQHIHGTSDQNAFWPGQLLDKMRLAMPPYDKASTRDKENAIFREVKHTRVANYNFRDNSAWPINDHGYLQSGIHNPWHERNTII